jgi:hypothetical protein
MLGTRKRKGRRIDERKKKALKDLNNRGKKRDGAVGGANVKEFARLGDGDIQIILADLHMAGRLAEFTERLKSLVIKEMPRGPRCFR